jgi:ADP-ribose pyrophosphatase
MLPELPKCGLILLESRAEPEEEKGTFMRLVHQDMRVRYPDGTESDRFTYDAVDRKRLDAVVVAAHYRGPGGTRHVFLRSALRPPVAMRPLEARPFPEKETLGQLWELPAGLVELDERTPDGLRRCAARELLEETGLDAPWETLAPLGPSTFPAPGVIGERHFYFHVEIEPARRGTPPEDGSALERHAVIAAIPLAEALDLCRSGDIEDAKTEIALRRLAEL